MKTLPRSFAFRFIALAASLAALAFAGCSSRPSASSTLEITGSGEMVMLENR